MSKEAIIKGIQSIIVNKFDIPTSHFKWNASLQSLNESFILLGILKDLEEALNDYFDIPIPLIENIETSIHTPNDIVHLIVNLLKK